MSCVRESLIAAVVDRLETISGANGYRSNPEVRRYPDMTIAPVSFPVLVVEDTTAAITLEPWPFFTYTLSVTVTILCASRFADSDLSAVLADIFQALGSDNTFGGLALGTTRITAADKVNFSQRETRGDAVVTLEIDYRTPQYST